MREHSYVWNADYEPFGTTNVTVNTLTNNLRFPGQYADSESGLYYNYFRDYNPSIGRYMQSDPIGLWGGLNTYGYANQSPLNYVDPNGGSPVHAVRGAFWVGGRIGAVINYGIQATTGASLGIILYEVLNDSATTQQPAANDCDFNPKCKLVDAEIRITKGDTDPNGVINLGKIVECIYQCPDGLILSQSHFIAPELITVVSTKEQALNWCPKFIDQFKQ